VGSGDRGVDGVTGRGGGDRGRTRKAPGERIHGYRGRAPTSVGSGDQGVDGVTGARAIGVGPRRIPAIEFTAIEGEHPFPWVPGTGASTG